MTDNALVISVSGNSATVRPLITGACINCKNSSCARQGKPFQVSNPSRYALKAGDIVSLKASRQAQSIQALLALILPIAAAVAGYLIAPKNEKSQTISSIAGFFGSALTVFVFTRLFPPRQSYVDSVITPGDIASDVSSQEQCYL